MTKSNFDKMDNEAIHDDMENVSSNTPAPRSSTSSIRATAIR